MRMSLQRWLFWHCVGLHSEALLHRLLLLCFDLPGEFCREQCTEWMILIDLCKQPFLHDFVLDRDLPCEF